MIFTALSYARMVSVNSSAGSSYSYALKIFGPGPGFMVGWLSLLDYLLLPLINVLLAKQYLSVIFPGPPAWIWVFVMAAVVTAINIRGILTAANVNSLFVYYQFAIVLIFVVLCLKFLNNGTGIATVFSLDPFYNEKFELNSVLNGVTILCFSFLGFDAVANYAEEATNAQRDVPRAIIITAILGGVLFIVASYFTQLVYPDIALLSDVENSTAAQISLHVGGRLFQLFFLAASFVGVFASGLASHASVSRLLYVMGRDGVLPKKVFGHISPRHQTPVINIVLVGLICLFALGLDVETAIHFISFGSLVAFFSVNLSVLFHFSIRQKQLRTKKEILFNLISPVAGLLVIIVLWMNIKSVAIILGSIWGIAGFCYYLFLTKVKKIQPGILV